MPRLFHKIPMYAQIRDILADRITLGEFHRGEKLPSERELCAEFNVSKHTTIRALNELVAMGLVRRAQGKGTFVAGTSVKAGVVRFVFYRTAVELPLDVYYASILGAVEKRISESGYDLAVSSVGTNREVFGAVEEGYLMVGPVPDEIVEEGVEKGVPVVTIDHPGCPIETNVVAFDEVASGKLAASVLLGKGCRDIGYVGEYESRSEDKREWPNSRLRRTGVEIALAEAGEPLEEERCVTICRTAELKEFIEERIEGKNLPEAFVTFNDGIAGTLLETLEEAGRRMDRERVVSFTSLANGATAAAGTRIAGDPGRLGASGADMLLRWMKKRGRKPERVLLERSAVDTAGHSVRP
ncbi:MAG: GntR family transcriptional regulator [Planctomycetes bacterium]|nr:GntR family transcriptional regulator [Planctomycetota bacterium]